MDNEKLCLCQVVTVKGGKEMVKSIVKNKEMETDVVVVGYGGAGAAAAITAHDNGARVIILEKMPIGGGSTSVIAGAMLIPTGMELVEYIDAI
jgi:ribulose 1,5-bisphosphate synthetase/thiazole synthase